MQVEATARRIHVQRLTDDVEPRHAAHLAGALVHPPDAHAPAVHLALPHIAEPRHGQPQSLQKRRHTRRLALRHRARPVQRRRFQQHIGHRREHHAAQHIVPRHIVPERDAQHLAAPVEERLHVAQANPGHEIHGEHVAGLGQAAQVEGGDARNAVLAEHHLAHLAGRQALALVGAHRIAAVVHRPAVHPAAIGAPQFQRPAHADIVEAARPARLGGQRAQRRLRLAEGNALGQKPARD